MPAPTFSPTTSKVKMVFALKHGNNNLKTQKNGKLVNPVMYNFSSLNKFPPLEIANRMIKSKSIQSMAEYKNANCLLFFETNNLGKYFLKIDL